jgi:hypothetical protein
LDGQSWTQVSSLSTTGVDLSAVSVQLGVYVPMEETETIEVSFDSLNVD